MDDQIFKSIEIEAPLARVWRALTDASQFGEWFRVKLDGPFVAGQATAGHITFPGYEHLRMEVVVQRIEPQSYFSFTWHPYAVDPQRDYAQETPTLVEFRLDETAGGTRVTVTESGFGSIPHDRSAEAFRMNSGGWEQQLQNLKAYAAPAA